MLKNQANFKDVVTIKINGKKASIATLIWLMADQYAWTESVKIKIKKNVERPNKF